MRIEWLPIFLSALSSGLLSLMISHIYYTVSLRSAERHQATAKRHAETDGSHDEPPYGTITGSAHDATAVEKDSGVEAARDNEGKLTGGLHYDGQFIAPPDVSPTAIAETLAPPRNNGGRTLK